MFVSISSGMRTTSLLNRYVSERVVAISLPMQLLHGRPVLCLLTLPSHIETVMPFAELRYRLALSLVELHVVLGSALLVNTSKPLLILRLL